MAINVEISKITGINQVGNSYQRKSAVPLDYYSLFNTKAEAEAYAASNPVSYVGQVISYIDEGAVKVCVIENTEGLLKEVGTAPIGDNRTIEVSAAGAISLLGATSAENGTLPMLEEVEEDGQKVSKLVWKTLEDIGAGDGNDNTTYEFTFTDEKIIITPKENGVAKTAIELDLSTFVTANELDEIIGVPADDETVATGLYRVINDTLDEAKSYADNHDNNTTYTISYEQSVETTDEVEGHPARIVLTPSEGTPSYIDATPFIKDGMLNNVIYTPENNTLTFYWKTEAGIEPIPVVLTDIIEPYNAGNGLDLVDNTFSVKLAQDTESFLSNGDTGLKLSGIQEAINTAMNEALRAAKDYADEKEHKNTTYTISTSDTDTKVNVVLTSNEGEAQTVELNTYNIDKIDKMLYEGKYDDIISNIPEEKRSNARLISDEEIKKIAGLSFGENGEIGISGTVSADKVTGLADAIDSRVTGSEGLNIARNAQVNVIETVKVNGTALTVTDKAVDVTVPTKVSDLTNDAGYVTNVRVKDKVTDGEGTTTYESLLKINPSTDSSTVLVVDDSGIQALIKQVKDTSDTAVQTAKFAGTAFTKTGTELSISQTDARTALGLGSAAYKDESAFAPADSYKIQQSEVTNKFTKAAHVLSTLSQNTNGEIAYEVKELTPADIGAQKAGNYKTEQTAVEDPTATAYTGSTLSYIETLSQDKNGVISATKRSFDIAAYVTNVIGDMTNIMNFRGVVTKTEAGFNSDIASITSPANGDVVLYDEYEYIYDGTTWKVFGDATGTLATAKQYTDDSIAALLVKNVDNKTLQLDENGVASIKTVSTDLLEQGEKELILFAGNSTGYTTNA